MSNQIVNSEILGIIGEEISKCKAELKKLPPVSQMIEQKKMAKYYCFSAQLCILQKVKREINKVIKKETAKFDDQRFPVSCELNNKLYQ